MMENDLISWSALGGILYTATHQELIMALEEAPAVDAVEVVRCKDCKHTDTDGCGAIFCKKWDRWEIPEDFFCGYEKRRADDGK